MSDRAGIIPLPGEKPVKAKLLVCAPSNAAIDEVCKRLMNGVPSSSGGRHLPVVVRIGVDQSVNDAVKDISLDNLVEARVTSEASAKDGGGGEYARIQKELEEVKAQIRDKQDELKRVQDNDEKRKAVENEYHSLSTRRTQLGQASSKAKDAARDATRHLEGARRAARDAILQEADIICATLSGAGQDSLAPYTFETVIIDEAAQAIEMSCLIPLKYGCKRCIMVGGER
jgi:senataxin